MESSKDCLVENILFKNSPYWTFWAGSAENLEIRWSDIVAKRDHSADSHSIIELSAFNTDGFDVSGNNVWIHDVNVWNQDDSICAKDGSTNMVFERINASGLGLTIGSIGDSINNNITFRDIRMHNTYKGVYMKFRGSGVVSNVVYENIIMDSPEQWSIWIGPAQQSDSDDLCAAHPCSICWPECPSAKCDMPPGRYVNITLRNITISSSKQSPGVILGNETAPIENLVFDNVVYIQPGDTPWYEKHWMCENVVNGVATGKTWPVPYCLEDQTDKKMHEINAADPRRIKSEHSVSSEVIAKVAAGAKSPQLAYISNLLPEVLL